MSKMKEFYLCKTYKTVSGRCRVTYRPDWSVMQPWASYKDGTAGLHFDSLESAEIYFKKYGDPLITNEVNHAS